MRRIARPLIAVLGAASLTACAGFGYGLSLMQDTISKFDQASHTIANGEMAFLRQVQAADCANQFYAAAFLFSTRQTDRLDLSGACTPTLLDDDMIQRRHALIDAVTLYVDKIQALSGNDRNTALDTASQKLATKLQLLAKVHNLSSGVSTSAGVEQAVVSIAEMALDQRRYEDIRTAAQAMAPQVTQLVETLKVENTTFAAAVASKVGAIEPQLHAAVLKARQDTGARSFLDVIAAREVVRSINPLGAAPVATTGGSADPQADPQNVAKSLNAALDALVNANEALAHAGTGGLRAAVNDALARGQSLDTLFRWAGSK